MGYDDHAEVSTERSANDKWFNIFGIFIARVVTLCFRVNGCAGFFGRIFMFLKYSLKTVMFPYLQKLLAISIEGFIWQMYFFFACPPNLGFFCFWHTSFRLKYFLSIEAPYTIDKFFLKGESLHQRIYKTASIMLFLCFALWHLKKTTELVLEVSGRP